MKLVSSVESWADYKVDNASAFNHNVSPGDNQKILMSYMSRQPIFNSSRTGYMYEYISGSTHRIDLYLSAASQQVRGTGQICIVNI